MKRLLTLLFILISYFAVAQTQPTLPPGSQIYSSNLFLAPDSTVWTGKGGLYINLGSKRIFDQLLAGKVDTAALNGYYNKTQIDAFLLLKEDAANKVTDLSNPDNTTYPTTQAVVDAIAAIPPTDLSNYYDKQETDGLLDTKIDTALLEKPNGVPLLDINGKIKMVNIPDQLIGAVNYQGTWSPATNTPELPAVPGPETKGHYYVASDSAEFNGQVYRPNDWIISSGSEWQIIEATNYVRRVNGKTGDVVLTAADVGGAVQTLSQPAIGQIAISNGNTINLNTVNTSGNQTGIAGNKTWTGAHTFSPLSGTGDGIVGVSAAGTLTRNNPSDLGLVPYTGATQDVDLGAQTFSIGGEFTRDENVFDQKILFPGTNNLHFRKLRDVAVLSRGTSDGATEGDIVITLPIRTTTKWVAKIDLHSAVSANLLYSPLVLYISGHAMSNTHRFVFGQGNIDAIVEVKFGRIGDDTVLIIKRSGDQTFSLARAVLSEFQHSVTYNAALSVKENYKIEFIKEEDLVGFTLDGTVTNAEFTRDPYYLDYNNFVNTPTIPAAQVNSDWNATSGVAQILNKPTIGDGTLTLETGTGLSGSASFSANQSGNDTFTVGVDAGYKLPTTAEWDGKAVIGTAGGQVRSNTDLDARYLQTGANISELVNDLNYTAAGSNITLFNNNAGYIVGGTAADQVRTNADLDGRYIQTELDPSVPQYVKDISSGDISNWNSKISSITGGTGITVDATDPYNPIINADGGASITLTGDVTGTGEGTIETTIADNAVSLDKIQEIPAGTILGLPGYDSNPWVETGQTAPVGIVNVWNAGTSYATNSKVRIGRSLYVALAPNTNTYPPTNPGTWSLRSSNFYGIWDKSVYYPLNAEVSSLNAGPIYRATSGVGGVEPWGPSSSDTPASPIPVSIGENLSLSQDGVLSASFSNPDINGLIVAGSNMTITGQGTYNNPYVLNSTGGGGSGGTTVTGGTNITVTGSGTSGNPYVVNNTYSYNLPVASASTLGGVRVGEGLSISGGVLSVTGGGSGSFQLRSGTNPYLTGQTTLLAGAGIQLTQSGSNITITNTGGGGGGGISALTGDVLASGSGSVTATIANGAVTNAKMANMPANTIKGRVGSSGAPQNLSPHNIRQIIGMTNEISGTTINAALGSKQYASISTNTTYSVINFDAGLELQVEITNTSVSPIEVNFTGVTFPVGYSNTIPAGRAAVFSMTKFDTIIRGTKVDY